MADAPAIKKAALLAVADDETEAIAQLQIIERNARSILRHVTKFESSFRALEEYQNFSRKAIEEIVILISDGRAFTFDEVIDPGDVASTLAELDPGSSIEQFGMIRKQLRDGPLYKVAQGHPVFMCIDFTDHRLWNYSAFIEYGADTGDVLVMDETRIMISVHIQESFDLRKKATQAHKLAEASSVRVDKLKREVPKDMIQIKSLERETTQTEKTIHVHLAKTRAMLVRFREESMGLWQTIEAEVQDVEPHLEFSDIVWKKMFQVAFNKLSVSMLDINAFNKQMRKPYAILLAEASRDYAVQRKGLQRLEESLPQN